MAQWWTVHLQCRSYRKCGFHPWVGKIPWIRKWQPTVVFLPGESHGQRSLAGYSPWGSKESETTEWAWPTSQVAQQIKNLPATQESQETRVQSLGQEDPLEEEMATRSNILAWRIPRTEETGRLQSMGSQRVRHDRGTKQAGKEKNSSSRGYQWKDKILKRSKWQF